MRSYSLANLTLLLVEDSPRWQKIIRGMQAALGVTNLKLVTTAEVALVELATQPADIVLRDRELPEMSGIDLVRRLRDETQSPDPFLPIIVLTRHTEKSRIEEIHDAGADAEAASAPGVPVSDR